MVAGDISKRVLSITLYIFFPLILSAWNPPGQDWKKQQQAAYGFYFTDSDQVSADIYSGMVDFGFEAVTDFFGVAFPFPFDVYVHPDRASLDFTWQQDWGMPGFTSACWMVASGIGEKLDILSPRTWSTQACEHSAEDLEATQRLITHELVHVFHGQVNASSDFSDITGLDWFVEGLATYASGQCDPVRMEAVNSAMEQNEVPDSLDQFWTGNIRYGLSGSMVMFIDHRYGREKVTSLLGFNRKADLLEALNTNESQLLEQWRHFMRQYSVE
ncbi:MAG: hypothetical protein GY751_01700 [Bacteroidetes bacterium]|nr:hypothetical protein [Bacteroidota bacterium]